MVGVRDKCECSLCVLSMYARYVREVCELGVYARCTW